MSQELQSPEPPVQRPRIARVAAPVRERKPIAPPAVDDDDEGFWAKHGVKLIVGGVVVALGVGLALLPKSGPSAPPRKQERIVQVSIAPPPPVKPPPPPPPQKAPPPEKKQEMEKQAPVAEAKPKEAPKKADNPPPTAMASGIKGDGPGAGLAAGGGGLGGGSTIGGNGGNGGGGGGRFDGYAVQLQNKIAEALRANAKTKTASINDLVVRIWPDASGKIVRATLASRTGNSAVDSAIENEVLNGLQLAEPPPAGMKLPINLRIRAKR